jgi:two-component system, OmpR family, response regulator
VLPPASGATAGSARSGPWASAHSGPSASVPGAAPSWAPRQASTASAPHAGSAASAPHAGSAASAQHAGSAAPPPFAGPAAQARLELDGLALYPHLHVVEVAGREIPLTPTEFLLLETLLCSGQVVRSKAQLARTLHGDDADAGTFVSKADERTVEVHVGNLRRKLADDPNEPRWIQTVRGVGYRMSGRPVVHG